MDKQCLILIMNETFDKEDNVVLLHFNDGSELLVNKKPTFLNLHMNIEISYDCNGSTINEVFAIPYNSVLYITLSNVHNLRKLSEQYDLVNDKNIFRYDEMSTKE